MRVKFLNEWIATASPPNEIVFAASNNTSCVYYIFFINVSFQSPSICWVKEWTYEPKWLFILACNKNEFEEYLPFSCSNCMRIRIKPKQPSERLNELNNRTITSKNMNWQQCIFKKKTICRISDFRLLAGAQPLCRLKRIWFSFYSLTAAMLCACARSSLARTMPIV